MVRVRVFEASTGDAITAIVYSNGYPVNVIVDKYYPFPQGKAFVLDAMVNTFALEPKNSLL